MPQFVIEREMPGVGALAASDLKGASQTSCSVLRDLGPEIQWVHSYVTDDKIYCIYRAPNEDLIREHAESGGFPANNFSQVRNDRPDHRRIGLYRISATIHHRLPSQGDPLISPASQRLGPADPALDPWRSHHLTRLGTQSETPHRELASRRIDEVEPAAAREGEDRLGDRSAGLGHRIERGFEVVDADYRQRRGQALPRAGR